MMMFGEDPCTGVDCAQGYDIKSETDPESPQWEKDGDSYESYGSWGEVGSSTTHYFFRRQKFKKQDYIMYWNRHDYNKYDSPDEYCCGKSWDWKEASYSPTPCSKSKTEQTPNGYESKSYPKSSGLKPWQIIRKGLLDNDDD